MFKLVRPCAKCPFRADVPGYLRATRAESIARSLAEGSSFACHETTEPDAEDESVNVETGASQFCAGALIVLENEGPGNNIMRIAERLGEYDAERLDRSAPVVASLAAFVAHHAETPEDEEPRVCAISDYGCDAPAGYLVGGLAIPATEGGEVSECGGCGEDVCESCMDGGVGDLCPQCAEHREAVG